MIVPDEIRKCVAFVGLKMDSGEMCLLGTAFFVAQPLQGIESFFTYILTAKHVIDGIKDKGLDKVFLRLNKNDDESEWVETNLSDWKFHPSDPQVDVALLQIGLPEEADHKFYSTTRFVTPEVIEREKISHGSEVFLVGLFAHHSGKRKNIPIIRVGNIAAMPEEPVETRLGSIRAYLIEARSIGGLSGSPVFANVGLVTIQDGQLKFATKGYPVFFLLGLMHGHWDLGLSDLDAAEADTRGTQRVNMGIGIVVPVEQIWEVIRQPAIAEAEAKFRTEKLSEVEEKQGTSK